MHLHDTTETLRFGAPLSQARGAVILIHGRGSSGDDIAGLAKSLPGDGIAFLAPSAAQGTWYPQRFFVPLGQNEPWLTSALDVIEQLVAEVQAGGVAPERIGLVGFSQGACLALEYALRNPRRYGFVGGLSGALIGPLETPRAAADLAGTPVLLGCAEHDAHIPLEFVERSAGTLAASGAEVTKQIYPGGAHTIFAPELAWLQQQVRALAG